MKVTRIIFYLISILVIGEVTDIVSICKKDATISFYSSDIENPLEEDESREYEEDEEFLSESLTHLLPAEELLSFETPSLTFELTEAVNEIAVPPPQVLA